MGGTCRMYEGEFYTGFQWENLKKGNHVEEFAVDGSAVVKRDREVILPGALDWFQVAQIRENWQAIVITAMNSQV